MFNLSILSIRIIMVVRVRVMRQMMSQITLPSFIIEIDSNCYYRYGNTHYDQYRLKTHSTIGSRFPRLWINRLNWLRLWSRGLGRGLIHCLIKAVQANRLTLIVKHHVVSL